MACFLHFLNDDCYVQCTYQRPDQPYQKLRKKLGINFCLKKGFFSLSSFLSIQIREVQQRYSIQWYDQNIQHRQRHDPITLNRVSSVGIDVG